MQRTSQRKLQHILICPTALSDFFSLVELQNKSQLTLGNELHLYLKHFFYINVFCINLALYL